MSIPLLEFVPSSTGWSGAFGPAQRRGSRALLAGFQAQVEASLGRLGFRALKGAAGALNGLLGSHYREEAAELAALAEVSVAEVLTANLAYDLGNAVGCSTFVVPTAEGPLLARNLDWTFPGGLLQKYTTIVRVHGADAGGYTVVTWPGLFGVLTGVAPGRFAVAVNYVHHASESGPIAMVKRAALGHWPVPWALRRVFDEAEDFREAVRLLKRLPLLSPVLFTIAGAEEGEAAVIERAPDGYATRATPVCTTNHYLSRAFEEDNGALEESDSPERHEALVARVDRVNDDVSALRLLSCRRSRRSASRRSREARCLTAGRCRRFGGSSSFFGRVRRGCSAAVRVDRRQ